MTNKMQEVNDLLLKRVEDKAEFERQKAITAIFQKCYGKTGNRQPLALQYSSEIKNET